jgi:hypothetical protein
VKYMGQGSFLAAFGSQVAEKEINDILEIPF